MPEWLPYKRAGEGTEKGIGYANIEPEIGVLITKGDGTIDGQTYWLIQHEFSIDDVLNMIEAREVYRSAEAAQRRNLDACRTR